MARSFNAATPDSFRVGVAVLTATPITVSAWSKVPDTTTDRAIFWLGDDASDDDFWRLSLASTGDVKWSIGDGGAAENVFTTTSYSTDTWHHVCGISASSTDHRVFIDGGGKGTSTTSTVPSTTPDRTSIGIFDGLTPADGHDGEVGHVAVWDVALTDNEVAILAAGASPLTVRPDSLVAYWPLNGTNPERDVVGGDSTSMGMIGVPTRAEEPTTQRRAIIAPPYQRLGLFLNDGVTDEHGDTGSGTVLDIESTDTVTLAFWFRTDSTGGNVQFMTKMLRSGTFRGFQYFCNAGSIQFFLANTNGSNHIYTGTVAATFNDGDWHLAVLTYDGSENAITGIEHFVDNVSLSDTIFGNNLNATCVDTGSEFAIGARVAGGTAVLQTQMDWALAAVFDKVLSDDEITELYHGGKIMDLATHSAVANLISWWRPLDSASSVVADQITTNDLTFVNIAAANFSDADVPL